MSDDDEDFSTMGISVLLVDSDLNSLRFMHNLMTHFSYQVTSYNNGDEAITFLMKGKHAIHLVIWDFHVTGLEALNTIGKDMNLPLVIMSHNHDKETVIKSTKYGACDFLVKPVSKEVIAVLWRHVYIKRMSKSGLDQSNEPNSIESVPNGLKLDNNGHSKEELVSTSYQKRKRRVVWTRVLHQAFESAVEKLSRLGKAYPKYILELMKEDMNCEGLTREHVASHLQKYRKKAKNNPNASLVASQPLLNSNINLHNDVPYYMNGQAAANATIQYPSSNGHMMMTNHSANLPYIDQPQQNNHYSLESPSVINTQEPGLVLSSAMDDLDYNPTLPYYPNEYFDETGTDSNE